MQSGALLEDGARGGGLYDLRATKRRPRLVPARFGDYLAGWARRGLRRGEGLGLAGGASGSG